MDFEARHEFLPQWYAILFNPYFIARRQLFKKVQRFSRIYGGGKKILDVGCGTKPYRSLFQKDDYLGIDIKDRGGRVDKVYDGQKIPYDKGEFDLVISTEVFEHVEHPEKLLSEIQRVLKKEGLLFLTMPFVWNEHERPYDFRRFTRFQHQHLLKENNFRIILIEPTTGAFGTCGQLISGFLTEEFSRLVNHRRMIFKYQYLIKKIFILLVCFPVQLIFLGLDLIFARKGITLDYIITAQKR